MCMSNRETVSSNWLLVIALFVYHFASVFLATDIFFNSSPLTKAVIVELVQLLMSMETGDLDPRSTETTLVIVINFVVSRFGVLCCCYVW